MRILFDPEPRAAQDIFAAADQEKFFKNLGGRLISSVPTPEDAINVILRRFERGDVTSLQAPQPWTGG